mmetsp:Transcript_59468/g.70870  ORF Transcript_59468/g.70870 Transcript_59468/m.70870 type:complete len:157 (+) Transcript_59468:87-557(+)
MNKLVNASMANIGAFEDYKHVSKLLGLFFNRTYSIDEFTSFHVEFFSPEEFVELSYPFSLERKDDFFKAILGLPAHSWLPEDVVRKSLPALIPFPWCSFVVGAREAHQRPTQIQSNKELERALRYAVEFLYDLMGNDADSCAQWPMQEACLILLKS